MARQASIKRVSNETDISLSLDLDSKEAGKISSGHGFLDHMLEQIARHGNMKLDIEATGDLEVDVHHLSEDLGIVFGQAINQALGDRVGLERYADAFVPMDETLAHVVIDLSGRPFIAFEPSGYEGDANGFNLHHLREFMRGFCNHAFVTMHIRVLSGTETHHVSEAIVKAFARALFTASRKVSDKLPSTKGLL